MTKDEVPHWALEFSQVLLNTIRQKDNYTYGHSKRVAHYAGLLAQAAGLSEADQKIIQFASLFHDIGKIGIPDHILLKPARLNHEEGQIMQQHPVKGAQILYPLSQLPFFAPAISGVLHHHERIDGKGYPNQLKGNEISIYAKIILIADTFDAMITTRPYRKRLETEVAYQELTQFSGTQFDSQLVQIFLKSHQLWKHPAKEIAEDQKIIQEIKKAA